MSEPIYATETTRGPDGTIYRKQVIYQPPAFPIRQHIIEERESKAVVLLTPGGEREVGKTKPVGKEKPQPILVASEYRLLRNPLDRHHATKMTEEEAIAFSRKHFKPETHRIIKAL